MADRRQRQPTSDQAPHAIPEKATVLTAPRQRAMPEPSHLEPKSPQRLMVQLFRGFFRHAWLAASDWLCEHSEDLERIFNLPG